MEPVVDRARCLMYVHTPRAVCMVPTRRGAYVDQGGPRRGQLEINCLPTTVCGDSAWDSVRGYIGSGTALPPSRDVCRLDKPGPFRLSRDDVPGPFWPKIAFLKPKLSTGMIPAQPALFGPRVNVLSQPGGQPEGFVHLSRDVSREVRRGTTDSFKKV